MGPRSLVGDVSERLLFLLAVGVFVLGGTCGPLLRARLLGVPEAAGTTRLADVYTGRVITGGLAAGHCVRLSVSDDDTRYLDPSGRLAFVADLALCWEDGAAPERGVNCGPPPESVDDVLCSIVIDAS
jgi:hypothetical protein